MQINEQLIAGIVAQVMQELANAPAASTAAVDYSKDMTLADKGPAQRGTNPKEVVIGIAPAFGKTMNYTIKKLPHSQVLREIIAGIEEEGCVARVVRVVRTSDVGFVGNYAAKLAGSGIGIGLQSKGTTVIEHKDMTPLTNLELFPLAPLVTLPLYRAIGRNAARYAKGDNPDPVPVILDQTVLPIYQPTAVLLHNRETSEVVFNAEHRDVEFKFSN
ncbi:MAG TPA: propanediol dehydratase [Syntrophomonas sp.]|nr:propanediol dehydratase [Syntrophomonas sp.]